MGRQLSTAEGRELVERGYLQMLTPKFRTLDNAMKEIKSIDPNTQITKHAIRCALLSGEIPSKLIGVKRVFDVYKVWQHFSA